MKTTIDMARKAGFNLEQGFLLRVTGIDEDLKAFEALIRNATLDEIAAKIEQMPFGDTAASFAVWIRGQKV